MRAYRIIGPSVAALFAVVPAAHSEPLSIVSVGAPAINCIYDSSCAVAVNDTTAAIPVAGISGRAILHSRTVIGAEGAPAAGMTGYMYRVNLTGAVVERRSRCVSALTLPFISPVKLPYVKGGPYIDIYVIAGGGLGDIGLASAEHTGNEITFTFSKPVCAGAKRGQGESSLFFGLTSSEAPKTINAQMRIRETSAVSVAARSAAAAVVEMPKPRSRSSERRVKRKRRR